MVKYRQISYAIADAIKHSHYKEGERLPSIRELADKHQCSKSTIIQALQELEQRQLIYSVPRSGHYVLKKGFLPAATPAECYDFATAAPDWNAFPYDEFHQCIRKALDVYQQELFIYGMPNGLPSLIKTMERHLQDHQVFVSPEKIVVTAGVQEALFILMSIPFPNNKQNILVEQPSYHLLIDYLNKYEIPAIGIERTEQGIDLDELERLFREEEIKCFYTMPRFHNPLGTSYSTEEKKAIVKLADQYDVYLVEDDFLVDYDSNSKADPMYSYDMKERVIYLKSFSKILFPGLRVGIAVLPKPLLPAFQQFKLFMNIDSSILSQAALDIYINSGMFNHHRSRIRAPYEERSHALNNGVRLMKAELQGVLLRSPLTSCMHTHVELDRRVNMNTLAQQMKKRKVEIDMLERNYLQGFPRSKIAKLNVSNIPIAHIPEGIQRLIEAIKASLLG